MLKNSENPAKPHFWGKWVALIVSAIAVGTFSYQHVTSMKNEYERKIQKHANIDKVTLAQAARSILIYKASNQKPELHTLSTAESVIERLTQVELVKMKPNTLLGKFDVYGNQIDFVGYKTEKLDVCEKMNNDKKIIKFGSIEDAFKQYGDNTTFCFEIDKTKMAKKYQVAYPVSGAKQVQL